jgi:hypothetical protein
MSSGDNPTLPDAASFTSARLSAIKRTGESAPLAIISTTRCSFEPFLRLALSEPTRPLIQLHDGCGVTQRSSPNGSGR